MAPKKERQRGVTVRARSRTPRARKAPPVFSRGARLGLLIAAVALVGIGLALGMGVSKPPPRPDLARLDAGPATEPATRSLPALSLKTSPRIEDPVPAAPGPPSTAVDAPEIDPAPASSAVLRWRPPRASRPRLAIVIDDLGRSVAVLDRLDEIGVPLTYSVLPYESRTPEVVARLASRGDEFLCHLPMEARGGVSAGPGALDRAMTSTELVAATERALAAVPGAIGANNHMGSEISADRRAMRAVLEVLAARDLYFLDSRTSPNTQGYTIAHQLGIPAAERQVFLDVERDPDYIRRQLTEAFALARRHGAAIAIAHPYPETLQVLAAELPNARAQGIDLVRASALLDG